MCIRDRTYIKRGKTVRRMDGRAMAAGSGADGGEPDALSIELEPKDYIVMLSDGVCDGIDDDWLRDCIAEFEGDSPNELSNKILEKAVECGGAVDDMTKMCIRDRYKIGRERKFSFPPDCCLNT